GRPASIAGSRAPPRSRSRATDRGPTDGPRDQRERSGWREPCPSFRRRARRSARSSLALAHTAFGAAYQSPQVRAMAEENERAGSDRGAEDLWRRTRDHRDRREGHGGGKRSQRDETREPDDREKHSGRR